MLTSQVGSSQGEALPGFTPLNLRDVSLSRRSRSTECRTRLPVPGCMNAPPTAAGRTQGRFVKNSQETALGAPPRLGPPALRPAPRCFARRFGHQPPGYWNGRGDCARPPSPRCALQKELPCSNSGLYSWSRKIYISTVFGFLCIQSQGPVTPPKLEA